MAKLEKHREKTLRENEDLGRKLRLGLKVFAVLVVIEALEFVLGIGIKEGAWPYLVILAVVGTWPIAHFYMHIKQVKHPEE